MSTETIPQTWLKLLTEQVFAQVSTSSKKVKTKDCLPDGSYPVIDQGQQHVAGYINDREKVIEISKPLVVFGDHTRAVKWVESDFVPGADGTKVLEAYDFLNPRFFYYQLRAIELPDKGYARHFKFLKESTFFLPPLVEQREIADRLDTLLAQVESIQTRLERVPHILKRFRQSVLAAAVSGKLTEEWRGEAEYGADGYPSNWKKKGFAEVGELARGKSKHRPRNDPRLFGREYPFIQTGEVANSGGKIVSANKFYSEFGLSQSKLFSSGTLCITIAANIADTAILNIDACFPDSVVGFTPNPSNCEVQFVKYLVDVNKENLERFAPATAQKNINLKVLNELRLPFPPLEEQTEIVRRVEQLFAYADTIEQQVNQALARVNNLTQSTLARAFSGELTRAWREANPELISSDNSAEALLARIQAERATQNKTSTKKSRTAATQ